MDRHILGMSSQMESTHKSNGKSFENTLFDVKFTFIFSSIEFEACVNMDEKEIRALERTDKILL